MGMYVAFGIAGILAFPVTVLFDALPGGKKHASRLWGVALVLFWIFLVLAALSSAAIGALAIPAHLLSAP